MSKPNSNFEPFNINGFGGAYTGLCSDRGYEAALTAWREHKKNWDASA